MTNQRFRNTFLDGCAHFVTASVASFRPILNDDETRRTIVRSWLYCQSRFDVEIWGFVVMPEHVHVLVRGSAEGARKFLQYSLQRSARHLRELYEARSRRGDGHASEVLAELQAAGKVWKERARCVAVSEERDVRVKLEYMHNNPVRRGLVEEQGQWPWSSWLAFYKDKTIQEVMRCLTSGDGCGN